MIYFTADLHLGHRGIIAMKKRPFRTVEEMNRALITNFNAVVSRRDTVYILGDICHHLDVELCNGLIRRLNGAKILLSGNHDKQYDSSLFADIRDFMTVSLNGVSFSLMHYPMLSWPHSEAGAVQLHGHIHASSDYNEQNRKDGILRYDVGVDANNYFPVSVKDVLEFFGINRA